VASKVTYSADAFFDFDKSVLKPEGKAKLDDLASKVKGINLAAQRTVAWKSKWSAPAPPSNLSIASRKSPGNGAFFMPGRRLQSPTIEP
jgi:OOP family OmpA-OmpF porin